MYGLNEPVEAIKRPRLKASRKKLEHLQFMLRSWRTQTKGKRIECQRHHLKNDVLSQFSLKVIREAIALAGAGLSEDGENIDQLLVNERNTPLKYAPLDVIFEFDSFEVSMLKAMTTLKD